jgi:hypothetical protein
VAEYARDMTAGRWLECPAPIIVGADVTLYDGQHRLAAIVSSGQPQTFLVARGAGPGLKQVIDAGMSRSGTNQLAALAKWVVLLTDQSWFGCCRQSGHGLRLIDRISHGHRTGCVQAALS